MSQLKDSTLTLLLIAVVTTSQSLNYWVDVHHNCDNVYFALTNGENNSTKYVTFLGLYSSTNDCINACINASISDDYRCESYTYYGSSTNNSMHCYGRFGSIHGVIWTPEPNQMGVDCGRIIYPCKSNIDCQLNGKCNINTGNCTCRPGWLGPKCQLLNLLPATKGNGYHITNDDHSGKATSSWGMSS